MPRLWRILFSLWVGLSWASPAFATEELKELLDRLLAAPTINGDFHVGQRELPDGFLVAIVAQ